jgi:hypothetical protein
MKPNRKMTLEKSIQRAEDALPRGWEIHVRITCSCAEIFAVRPDMSEVGMDDGDLDYDEQYEAAINLAGAEVMADLLSENTEPTLK